MENNNTMFKRDKILFTAIDVISEFGMQGVSTKEIARRIGISEGIIFKYFPKKSDLLAAVLDCFSLYDNDIYATAKGMNPIEAIIYIVNSFSIYYENYPAITAVYQAFYIFWNDPELGYKIKEIFKKRDEYIKKLVEAAIEDNLIKKDTDSSSLAVIINSTIRGIYLKWRLENYTFSLKEEVFKSVNMLLTAFKFN